MTSPPSFTFFSSYLLVFPLLVGFLFQEESWCSQLLPTFFSMVGLLWAMGVCAEPSLNRTLPGAYGISSLRDEVSTLPGGFAQTPVGGHTPQSLGTLLWLVPIVSAPSKIRCGHSPVDGHTLRSLGTLPVTGHPPLGVACSLSSL